MAASVCSAVWAFAGPVAWSAVTPADAERAILLRDGTAALAALGFVDEPLLGVELLLAGAEDEVHPAVTAADGLVGVHPFPSLLCTRPDLGLDDRRAPQA